MKHLAIISLLISQLFSANTEPIYGQNGMVVSTSRQASEAGIEILKNGGNAVDAAVAVGFALAVTSSSNGNIGGGGFMVSSSVDGESFTLDYREKAPAKGHRDMFLNDSGNVVPNMSLYSRAAAGVPGSVDGLLKALSDHGSGRISIRQVMAPAIRLAQIGFILSKNEADRFNRYKPFFERYDAVAEIFIKDNSEWKAGRSEERRVGKECRSRWSPYH